MQAFKDLLGSSTFKMPPPEVVKEASRRAKIADEEERRRQLTQRFEGAHIPPEFVDADINVCDDRVAAWVDRIRDGSTRNLILQGKPGVGKSYSAAAALRALLLDRKGKFAREVDLVSDIRGIMSGRDHESEVVGRYSYPPILVFDDFGKMQARDWYLPILWEIIDNRYTYRKPIIFTMQGDSSMLAARLSTETDQGYTAAAILDRMKDSDVVFLEGSSRRGHRA